jgi:hypothetical protein
MLRGHTHLVCVQRNDAPLHVTLCRYTTEQDDLAKIRRKENQSDSSRQHVMYHGQTPSIPVSDSLLMIQRVDTCSIETAHLPKHRFAPRAEAWLG